MLKDIGYFVTHVTWDQLQIIGVIAVIVILISKALGWILRRLHNAIIRYPNTQFGFRGKLVYTDDNPQAKVFVSHRYELSAKPDFIFKTGLNEYVVVEYKSRKSSFRQSDLNQLKATVLACRSQYRIVAGYVVTGSTTKHITFGSSHRLYREIKDIHSRVKKIKFCNAFPPKREKQEGCGRCGFYESCMSERKFNSQ